MDSNRTLLIAIVVVIMLAGTYYLATLRSLVNMDGSVESAARTPINAGENVHGIPTEAAQTSGLATAKPSDQEPIQGTETTTTDGPGVPVASSDKVDSDSETDVDFYSYRVLNSYPHDHNAFTQGLVWHQGYLYEGTGLRERSSLRKVNLTDGSISQRIALPDELFGEGVTIFDNRIYQLTWQANVGFIYDLATFTELDSFSYPTEGWGITHDSQHLIMSDGSTRLYFWDPETLDEVSSIEVSLRGEPVNRLNELEYINGLIYANIWQTNWIAMISPESGTIRGMINLEGLLQIPAGHNSAVDVLNGIAYDHENDRLFVTGKLWPQLYEIELVEDDNVGQ